MTDVKAIEFWQKEIHYYEGRARESGRQAFLMVAAGIPVLVAAGTAIVISGDPVALAGIPILLAVIFATAVRNFDEMHRLALQYDHAELQLLLVTRDSELHSAYRPWLITDKQLPWRGNAEAVWNGIAAVVLALVLGVTFWQLGLTAPSLVFWIVAVFTAGAFAVLAFTYIRTVKAATAARNAYIETARSALGA